MGLESIASTIYITITYIYNSLEFLFSGESERRQNENQLKQIDNVIVPGHRLKKGNNIKHTNTHLKNKAPLNHKNLTAKTYPSSENFQKLFRNAAVHPTKNDKTKNKAI